MDASKIIVREYLNSLKEDEELDKLLPILLSLKGLKIVRIAKEAKGQSQQGKDIIAYGKDQDGMVKRFYFEVKGHADKDIDEASIAKKDGIRDSLFSAYYAPHEDYGIAGFNDLPVKIILVHNGVLKPLAQDVFNGVIRDLFRDGKKEFERWDIYRLMDEFSQYLFGEYLLTEENNIQLLKRALVFLDVPEYNLADVYQLIDNLLADSAETRSRKFKKMFASLNLVSNIIWHYSRENNNLLPAIKATSCVVLKTWAWILRHKAQSKKRVKDEFKILLATHYDIVGAYVLKTIPAALNPDGLVSETGGPFEDVGYSLRGMDYLHWLVYLSELILFFGDAPSGEAPTRTRKELWQDQTKLLYKLISFNEGCKRPLMDGHCRPIVSFALFILNSPYCDWEQKVKLSNYLVEVTEYINLIHAVRKRWPEFRDNIYALIEFSATGKRPSDYSDSGSILLLIMAELFAILGNNAMYGAYVASYKGVIDLQMSYPNWQAHPLETEIAYFSGSIVESMVSDASIELPEDFDAFVAQVVSKKDRDIPFVTDQTEFPFLRTLSVLHFGNDHLPSQWRKHLSPAVQKWYPES